MSGGERLPIDLRLLEPFVVLAEELHFTRAAERLHVAQPALSQQIARLERQLGMVLFTRPPEPVALTAAGAVLLPRARRALGELRVGIDEARAVAGGRAGPLRLGHLSSLGPLVVPAIAAGLRDARPDVVLTANECSVEEQLDGLEARTLDVGLLYVDPELPLPVRGLVVDPVAAGPSLVALPASHALAERARLELSELATERWIEPTGTSGPGYQAAYFRAACARHGFTPDVVGRANNIETMVGLVAAGFGVAPAPWTVALRGAPPGVTLVPVEREAFALAAVRRGCGEPGDTFLAVARAATAGLLRAAGHAPA